MDEDDGDEKLRDKEKKKHFPLGTFVVRFSDFQAHGEECGHLNL